MKKAVFVVSFLGCLCLSAAYAQLSDLHNYLLSTMEGSKSEATPFGVPSNWSWVTGATSVTINMPDNFSHANYWGAIFRGNSNTTPANTEVQIRNMSFWVLYKGEAKWIEFQNQKSNLGGGTFSPTYNSGGPAPKLRHTIEGSFVVPAPGYIWHFWNGPGYQPIRYNDIQEVMVNANIRLVLKDSKGVDDRDQADYLIHVGADWRDPKDPNCEKLNFICTPFGISKFVKLTNEWTNCTFHSLSKTDLNGNVPLPPKEAFLKGMSTIKVMPLGDSKTEGGGGSGNSSWRGYLRTSLMKAGHSIDYVGYRSNAADGDSDPKDTDHAGFGGYTIGPDKQVFSGNETTGIIENLPKYFTAANPDVVLLAIGVNDFFNASAHPENYSKTAPERYQNLVNKIIQLKPNVKIILGSVEPVKWDKNWGGNANDNNFGALNAKIKQIADADLNDNIYFADIRKDFLASFNATDFFDDVHLSKTGAQKVAASWFKAVDSLLTSWDPRIKQLVIKINSPLNKANLIQADTTKFEVNATITGGSIEYIDFYLDGTKISTDSISPYLIEVTALELGTHFLKALCNYNRNETQWSDSITVEVTTSIPPTIKIIAPVNGSLIKDDQQTVLLTAEANDSDGAIGRVAFFLNGELIGEVYTSPFILEWPVTGLGKKIFTAVAVDNTDTYSTASRVTINVGDCGTGVNLMPNNEFDNGYLGWRTWFGGTNKMQLSIAKNAGLSGENALHMQVTEATALDQIRVSRKFNFEKNKTYCFSFMAKASADKAIKIRLKEKGLDGLEYWSENVTITKEASYYGPFQFTSIKDYQAGDLEFQLGTDTSDVWIDQLIVNDGGAGESLIPVVSISEPLANSTFKEGAEINVSITATDLWGFITKVELLNGTEKIGETAAKPYQFKIENLKAGMYSLTAKATNDHQLTTTSSVVSFNVQEVVLALGTLSSEAIKVYPNPTSDYSFSVETGNLSPIQFLEVLDLQGRKVSFDKVSMPGVIQIKLSESSADGIYLVKMILANKTKVAKLLVKRK